MPLKNKRNLAAFASAAIVFCAPLNAQETAADPEIVVERSTQKEIREEIWETFETTEGYITAFHDKFCPGVVGFDPELAILIADRMRANATAAGYDVPGAPCDPTAIVIFSDDPQAIVDGLRQKRPGLFESNFTAEIRSLVAEDRPYYSWKVIEERTQDGIPIRDGENRQAQATRLSANVRYDIVGSYLVLDINKTPGMTISQIADFATLHSLIEFDRRAAEKSAAGSILKLFHVDDPTLLPDGMSTQDKATILSLSDDRIARLDQGRQRNRLASTIRDEVEQREQSPAQPSAKEEQD